MPLNGGHPRPIHHADLYYFLMWPKFTPKTGKPAVVPPNLTTGALRETIGSGRTKIRGRGADVAVEIEVRAAGGRAMAAHRDGRVKLGDIF